MYTPSMRMQKLIFLRVCINIVWATETPIVICFYFFTKLMV